MKLRAGISSVAGRDLSWRVPEALARFEEWAVEGVIRIPPIHFDANAQVLTLELEVVDRAHSIVTGRRLFLPVVESSIGAFRLELRGVVAFSSDVDAQEVELHISRVDYNSRGIEFKGNCGVLIALGDNLAIQARYLGPISRKAIRWCGMEWQKPEASS
jgi:hypothetical protein